jgi:hypothetical protein
MEERRGDTNGRIGAGSIIEKATLREHKRDKENGQEG